MNELAALLYRASEEILELANEPASASTMQVVSLLEAKARELKTPANQRFPLGPNDVTCEVKHHWRLIDANQWKCGLHGVVFRAYMLGIPSIPRLCPVGVERAKWWGTLQEYDLEVGQLANIHGKEHELERALLNLFHHAKDLSYVHFSDGHMEEYAALRDAAYRVKEILLQKKPEEISGKSRGNGTVWSSST